MTLRFPGLSRSLHLFCCAFAFAAGTFAEPPRPSTFSIVAADPATGEVGVAVASRFFAVGSVVPFARAGVGAVATQASANTTDGPGALELLARGASPGEALGILTRGDDGQRHRQAGVVAADGRSATFTGPEWVLYDAAVIRLANGDSAGARAALDRALALNPKLAQQAAVDGDLAGLREAKP